jgi:undecaprenyl-diphosphatase
VLDLINAAILGLIEGITEFLPISSTAHLVLTANLLHLQQSDYMKSFEIIIQLGAILAVVWLYWKSFLDFAIFKRLVVAFIPTGIVGLLLYKIVKSFLIGNTAVILWSLFLGGIGLVLFEKYFFQGHYRKESDLKNITYTQCVILGLFQSIAIIPGVSRSAATIIGGLFLGISRKTIVEFSFLLAVPTMLAATGLDFIKNAGTFNSGQFYFLAVGFITSFVMAILSIRWLLNFIKKRNFIAFGAYRIVLVVVYLVL